MSQKPDLEVATQDIMREIGQKLPVTDAIVILVNRNEDKLKIGAIPGDLNLAMEVLRRALGELQNEAKNKGMLIR